MSLGIEFSSACNRRRVAFSVFNEGMGFSNQIRERGNLEKMNVIEKRIQQRKPKFSLGREGEERERDREVAS